MESFFSGKKIVVTGGGGFIGSHLVEKLIELGSEVVIIDPMIYGNKIKYLKVGDNLSIYKIDVRNYEEVYRVTKDASILYHLASIVGVENAYNNPVELLEVDIKGTENVLRAAVDHNIEKVIFASSSEVYGDINGKLIEDGPFACKTTYGYAKLIGEEYCRAYYQQFGLNYVCLRYFNIYGPRQDERFVIPRFVKNCLQKKPPLIYGNGKQTRDFTYIDDAIRMTLLATTLSDANNQSINIGTGRSITITDLAELVLGYFNKSKILRPTFISYTKKRPEKIEIYNRIADISKAKIILKYEPQEPLENGIRKYIEWFLKNTRISE